MSISHLSLSILFLTLIAFSGCSSQPKPAPKIIVDPSLEMVTVNGTLSDTTAIAFEWRPLQDTRAVGIRIYRDDPLKASKSLTRIATVDNRIATHYVDNNLEPGTLYNYRFSSYGADDKESKPSKTVTAATLKRSDPVSFFAGSYASKSITIKLIWRPHSDGRITAYELERKSDKDKDFSYLALIEGRLQAEYVDTDVEQNRRYQYRLRAITFDGHKSEPSKTVSVSTKPLPQTPTNLLATNDLAHEIKLSWTPSATPGVTRYKIFRSTSEDGEFSPLASVKSPRYADKTGQNGVRYFYRVSAADVDDLISPPSKIAEGATLSAPSAPRLIKVTQQDGAALLHYSSDDPRTVSYVIVKTTKLSWVDKRTAEFKDVKTTHFSDVNIVPGREYLYRVIAVDKHGLRSKPSEEQSLVPEDALPEESTLPSSVVEDVNMTESL